MTHQKIWPSGTFLRFSYSAAHVAAQSAPGLVISGLALSSVSPSPGGHPWVVFRRELLLSQGDQTGEITPNRPSIHSCDCGSRLRPAVLSGLWFTLEWHPQLSEGEPHQTIRKHVGKASSMQETHVENFSIRSRCIIMFTFQLLARWVLFRTITYMI